MNRHTSISVRLVCLVILGEGPSTSSDVPMTPVPVSDEFADEPDTSEIPVFPNSVYAPVRNPRVRWPTSQIVSPIVVSSQNVPAFTPSWSPPLPVTCETPSVQQPVTPPLMCNLSSHRQRPQHDDDRLFPHVGMGPSGTRDTVDCHRARYTISQQMPLPPTHAREETNMSTGDSIIPSPRDSMCHSSSSRNHGFHLWQSVGDLAHFISRILNRSVGDPTRCIPSFGETL